MPRLLRFLVVLFSFALLGACGRLMTSSTQAPLADVSPLPAPSLPAWIEQISPTGTVKPLAQIVVIFKTPVVPLGILEDPSKQQALANFSIAPQLPGHFRFLTPRMVGFQADRAIPLATRVRITLHAGLADLAGDRLERDVAWTFQTGEIDFGRLPGIPRPDDDPSATPAPSLLRPTLTISANTPVDVASLASHASLVPENGGAAVGLDAALIAPGESPPPQAQFDASAHHAHYRLTPKQELATATHYRLVLAAGIAPAAGNLPSRKTFEGRVWTYAPLRLVTTERVGVPDANGAQGRFTNGALELDFSNPLVPASAKAITVSPAAVHPARLLVVNDGDSTVGLNPYALAPDTKYSVTVGPSLSDVFGQTLGSSVHAEFTTGDIAPDFWAPSGLNVFPAGRDLQIDLTGTNLPDGYRAAYRKLTPVDLVFNDDAAPREDGPNLLPDKSLWPHHSLRGPRNRPTIVHVPLRAQLGGSTGALAYGATANTYTYTDDQGKRVPYAQDYAGIVQITNLAVFAQWFPAAGFVRVQHLSDGSPARSAAVTLYTSRTDAKAREPVSPCANGRTDGTGTWTLTQAQMIACIVESPDRSQAPEILAVASEGSDWAFVRTKSWSGSYGYGIDGSWPGNAPDTLGTVYSDRQLYQPGEVVWLTGAAYVVRNGMAVCDCGTTFALTLTGPSSQKVALGTATADAFGSFAVRYAIPKNAGLGYWSVDAKASNGDEFGGDFRVAEFRPPNFKTTLTLGNKIAAAGTAVNATAQSTYLFGTPVAGARAQWTATRDQTSFAPKGWDAYTFGPQWFWPEDTPSVSSDVLQVDAQTDAAGNTTHPIPVATDLPYPMKYTVSLETTDAANLAVADTKSFTALPSTVLIGVKNDFVATAGQPTTIGLVVTDPQGAPTSGQKIHIALQLATYPRATQLVEGGETGEVAVVYTTVAQTDVTSTNGPLTVSLTPTKPGAYRIEANLAAGGTRATATDAQLFVAGEGAVDWGGQAPDVLQLKLDQATYKVGDQANLLVESPFPQADLYLVVVRNGVLAQSIVHVNGTAPQVHFTVTPAMLPNAAVEALLVRRGAPLASLGANDLTALAKIGLAPFNVDVSDKVLKVAVAPGHAKLGPGGAQAVGLEVKDVAGRPVRSELTVMVVNDAILQLSGYRPPKLGDLVYATQSINTRFADSRQNVVLKPLVEPLEKGYGYGGGFLAGAAGTRVRTNFQPLAYYGKVRTDDRGAATVHFTLPDDLTTWRVMAVASTTDLRFGNGEATFITTKPLLANPVLPQFARPGDRFEGGVSITNSTGASAVAVQGSLEGALGFGGSGDPHARATAAPGTGTFVVRFPMAVGPLGPARAGFVVRAGGASDAFAIPFELRTLPLDEASVTAGTTASSVTIPLSVAANVVPDAGGLDLTLASSVLGDVLVPAAHVLDQTETGVFLPDAAARLDIAAAVSVLGTRYQLTLGGLKPGPAAAAALTQLASLQLASGGLRGWPGASSAWPAFSAYTGEALGAAAAAGIATDAGMRARLKTYLAKDLADPKSVADWCTSAQCKAGMRLDALYGLAALGDVRDTYLSDIVAQQPKLLLIDQVRLARYLLRFPQWAARGRAMADKLGETVYLTGRTATLNSRWAWPGSPAALQAELVRLLVVRKAPLDEIDGATRALLQARRDGTWGCAFYDALALDGLVAYAGLQPTPPSFTATARLDAKTLLTHRFEGYRNPTASSSTPMRQLPRGAHALVLAKSGRGTLHYVAAYRYQLAGPQPGALSGLRVIRQVTAPGSGTILASFGLAAPTQTTSLPVGSVYDVGISVITDHPVEHVMITDPLPAGLEAVDASFRTTAAAPAAAPSDWQLDDQQIYRDRVVVYADHLDSGIYTFHYFARAVTPGTFAWPGTEAHLAFAPEEFGRTASGTLTLTSP